jgi:hypothetical protein
VVRDRLDLCPHLALAKIPPHLTRHSSSGCSQTSEIKGYGRPSAVARAMIAAQSCLTVSSLNICPKVRSWMSDWPIEANGRRKSGSTTELVVQPWGAS